MKDIYDALLELHGHQGWWPLHSLRGSDGFDERGYHPGRYDYPRTDAQRFEIIIGAILTQNTAWTNVEKALDNLRERGFLDRRRLGGCDLDELAGIIRPSGYFRQKARKIREVLAFLDSGVEVTRENLLGVWGIGPETADSILLYAYGEPVFVVDAYTKRVLEGLGRVREGASYDEVQRLFHESLPADPVLYNEFHALLVTHAKRYHSKSPDGDGDPLLAFRKRNRRRR